MKLLYVNFAVLCILGIAAASPETITDRYSELGMLDRDGGTAIDSFNLLRCLQLFNVTNGTYAAVDSNEQLVIVNANGFVNHTKLKEDLGKCYSVMGMGLAIELVNGVDIFDNGYERIDLSKTLDKNQVSKFTNVSRNAMTGMSHNGTSALEKKSGVHSFGGLQASGEYLAYYSMRVDMSRPKCTGDDELYRVFNE